MKEQKFWKNVEWFHFLFSIFVIWIHADNISNFTEAGAQVTGPFVLEGFIIKYLANLGVAGFYLCSGYLFYRGFTMEKLPGKWKSRVKTLVLPYILWNLIYYILHYTVLQIPKLAGMFADRPISLSLQSMLDAVIWYRYNPVFWYLQFLIIFVFLCPVIYMLLKNRYVGGAVLVGVLLLQSGMFYQVQHQMAGALLNWFVVYGTGAWLGLHGRNLVEKACGRPNVESGIKENASKGTGHIGGNASEGPGDIVGKLEKGSGPDEKKKLKGSGHIDEKSAKGSGPHAGFAGIHALAISGICMLVTGILYGKGLNVAFSLLYFLAGAAFFWLLLDKIVKHEARSWMKLTFFVYASHQMVVSVVTKLGVRILGANAWIGLFLFIAAPIYSFFLAWICKKILSGKGKIVWNLLTGNR